MRWRWCLLLFVQAPIILTKNVHHTREARECCPCPEGIPPAFNKESLSSYCRDVGVCTCPPRLGDSEPAAATDSARSTKSVLRNHPKSKDDAKPLLHPEVDFASSVLHTLQKATDEEYREALERDAARNAAKESANLEERPESNLVTIVLNTPDIYDMDTAGEESKIQEARCAPLHLGNEYTLNQPNTNILGDLFKPIKLEPLNIFDQGIAASNLRNNVIPSNLPKPFETSNLFPEFTIPDLRISPLINRFTETQNGRNSVMKINRSKPGSFTGTKRISSNADSDIGASNNNEVVIREQINCDDSNKVSNSKQKSDNHENPSKFSFNTLSQLHQANLEQLNNKLQDGHERIANFLLEPFKNSKHKVDVEMEPMKLDNTNMRQTDNKQSKVMKYQSKDSECDPNNQFEIIDKLDNEVCKEKVTQLNNDVNYVKNFNEGSKQSPVKQDLEKQTNPNFDDNCNPLTTTRKTEKNINDFDLETMSNNLLEKSIKMKSKNLDRDDVNSQMACDHESLSRKHVVDTSGGASENIFNAVPFISKNLQENAMNKLRSNLIVQPDDIGEHSSLFNIKNPLTLELPSINDIREKMEEGASSLFNTKNPLAFELPSVDKIKDKFEDSISSFNVNNPINLGLPTVDDIRQGIEDRTALFNINNPLNVGLPSVDDIRERIEDSASLFTNNNPFKIELPSLDGIRDTIGDSAGLQNQVPFQLPSLDDIRDRIEESSVFNVNNPIQLELPSIDDIKDKLEDVSLFKVNDPINLNLPDVDDIKDKIEDFLSSTSDLKLPRLDYGQMKVAANEPALKFQLPQLKLNPQDENKDGFNLELFRLNPVFSALGKEREVLNTGLNLNSFKTTLPEFKELPLKPIKLESIREANGNIFGASLSLKDIDSHLNKIKTDMLQSPINQLKEFTNNPNIVIGNIGTVGKENRKPSLIGIKKPSSMYKTTDFNPFDIKQKPLKASIQVPTLKPLPRQSQNNIVTTPKTTKINIENNNKIIGNYRAMDPIMKAAIVKTLTNTNIGEPATTKPYSMHIIKDTQDIRPSSVKETVSKLNQKPLKIDTKRILNNNDGLKSLHENELKSLQKILPLRHSNLDLLGKGLLGDPLNLFTKNDVPNNKIKGIRKKNNKAKLKDNRIKSLNSPKTIKLTPNHSSLKLDSQISPKKSFSNNYRKPLLKSIKNQPHLSQEDDDFFSKLIAMPSLSLVDKPLKSLSFKEDRDVLKLDDLFGRTEIPNKLLLPQANLPSLTSWPKNILNLSDLRSSADTITPVVACNDNDVGSSNNFEVVESINTNNNRQLENSAVKLAYTDQPNSQRSEDENCLNEDTLESRPVKSFEHKTTPLLEKLRESIKTSFDELNNRVTDNLKALIVTTPREELTNCVKSPNSDSIVEPTSEMETITEPDIPVKQMSVPKVSETLEDDPCQQKLINLNDDNSQIKDTVVDNHSEGISGENRELDTDNEGDQSVIEDNTNEITNCDTEIINNENNELHDSIVEPTNNIQDVANNDFNHNRLNNKLVEENDKELETNVETKLSNDCDGENISNTLNDAEQTNAMGTESKQRNQEIVESSECDDSQEKTLDNEHKNKQINILDKIRDQFESSLKSLTDINSNDNKLPILPFTNKDREESETSRPLVDRKQSNAKPFNDEINNLLDRIKNSLPFNRNDDSIERSGKEECSDSTDSAVEASNNIPVIEEIQKPTETESEMSPSADTNAKIKVIENEPKMNDEIDLEPKESTDCVSIAEKSLELPSSLCGKGVPVGGDVSYKCRLVCTKE